MRCIGLTEGRRDRVVRELSEWRAHRPRDEARALRVSPVELAKLLGHLVFVSQVVPGGRTAMLAMLSSFRGMVVDWKRGRVSAGGEAWRRLEVRSGFWDDLDWWEANIRTRNCVPMGVEPRGVAAVAGTDASGWGAGGLVWVDG